MLLQSMTLLKLTFFFESLVSSQNNHCGKTQAAFLFHHVCGLVTLAVFEPEA